MSIRTVLLWVFGALLAFQGAIAAIAWRVDRLQESMAAAQTRRLESWRLATELRGSSDELTRMARTFAVTADPAYESYFDAILAIRNGTMPRPEGYGGIYWDFVVASRAPISATGEAVALQELMRRLEFTAEEFGALQEAQRRSDALIELEARAINAVKGRFPDGAGGFTVAGEPDLALARELLHGPEYHRAKAEIMGPIAGFFDLIDRRTEAEVAAASAAAERGARLTFALTIAGAALVLAAFLLIFRLTIRPIRAMIVRIRDIAEGDGDLTRRIDATRRNELGELARWFNRFIEMVQGIARQVTESSTTVAAASAQIAATARGQASSAERLGASARQIAVAVDEISTTGHSLAGSMTSIGEAATAASGAARSGRAGLDAIEPTMQGLIAAASNVTARFAALRARAEAIGSVAGAVGTIAGQTNILSVNAAIEASKAREHGAGFRVLAEEIRRLADRSAAAAMSIERDVEAMQAAMAEGSDEISRFGETVHTVVDRVQVVAGQFGEIIEEVQGLSGRFQAVTAGAEQQAVGIRQIGAAMRDLDADAERSRASVHELSGAADQLHEATALLRGEVARFRLER
ncbi:MAG TPA: methyl-accepting chemotaxis protein [Phycisphaerales bacterium]|nr:methyl-accepting chemotaxis protein [Phycisphaerales bacterium]HMP36834.1 methyl-accepting chemotaxis protein [Phycisphaerales bacterium]